MSKFSCKAISYTVVMPSSWKDKSLQEVNPITRKMEPKWTKQIIFIGQKYETENEEEAEFLRQHNRFNLDFTEIPEDLPKINKDEPFEMPPPVNQSTTAFKSCAICGKAFKTEIALKMHIGKYHKGQ